MTFKEWFHDYEWSPEKEAWGQSVWNAAQQAERDRIKQIVEEVSWKGDHDKWFDCVDAIAERIEECSK